MYVHTSDRRSCSHTYTHVHSHLTSTHAYAQSLAKFAFGLGTLQVFVTTAIFTGAALPPGGGLFTRVLEFLGNAPPELVSIRSLDEVRKATERSGKHAHAPTNTHTHILSHAACLSELVKCCASIWRCLCLGSTHTNTHTHKQAYTFTHTQTHTHTYKQAYTFTHTHTHTHKQAHTHTYTHVYLHLY
jgi:hypothetical protein